MLNKISLLALVIIVFGYDNAFAKKISDASVDKLLLLSGIEKQIEKLPIEAKSIFAQYSDNMPAQKIEKINKIIDKSYSPLIVSNVIRQEMKRNLLESEAQTLLVWYQSALGKAITRAEENTTRPETVAKTFEPATDENRVTIAEKIQKLTHITSKRSKTTENMLLAIKMIMAKYKAPNKPINIPDVKKQVAKELEPLKATEGMAAVVALVYFYKDIEISDLKKYTDFLSQAESQRFMDALLSGMTRGTKEASKIMAGLALKEVSK